MPAVGMSASTVHLVSFKTTPAPPRGECTLFCVENFARYLFCSRLPKHGTLQAQFRTCVNNSGLWNLLSNPQKTNVRCVENTDVHTFEIDGAQIILVYVHEAMENMKPVYINGKMENTFIRTGDGDRKATQEELNAFLRKCSPGARQFSCR